MHHLNDRAMNHAKTALELQPDYAGAKQIVTLLERSMHEPAAKPAGPRLRAGEIACQDARARLPRCER